MADPGQPSRTVNNTLRPVVAWFPREKDFLDGPTILQTTLPSKIEHRVGGRSFHTCALQVQERKHLGQSRLDDYIGRENRPPPFRYLARAKHEKSQDPPCISRSNWTMPTLWFGTTSAGPRYRTISITRSVGKEATISELF